jgi:hypothetical protein
VRKKDFSSGSGGYDRGRDFYDRGQRWLTISGGNGVEVAHSAATRPRAVL